jgi:hypothetical protein
VDARAGLVAVQLDGAVGDDGGLLQARHRVLLVALEISIPVPSIVLNSDSSIHENQDANRRVHKGGRPGVPAGDCGNR